MPNAPSTIKIAFKAIPLQRSPRMIPKTPRFHFPISFANWQNEKVLSVLIDSSKLIFTMKITALLLSIASLVAPSEQAGLRKLNTAPDCDVVETGFQTCKSDSQYYECAVNFGLMTRWVAGGTKCCPDYERENRIFMVLSGVTCDTPEPSPSPSNAPSRTPTETPTQVPSAAPSESPTTTCESKDAGDQWCFSETVFKECAEAAGGELEVLKRGVALGTRCCPHTDGSMRIIEQSLDMTCPEVTGSP